VQYSYYLYCVTLNAVYVRRSLNVWPNQRLRRGTCSAVTPLYRLVTSIFFKLQVSVADNVLYKDKARINLQLLLLMPVLTVGDKQQQLMQLCRVQTRNITQITCILNNICDEIVEIHRTVRIQMHSTLVCRHTHSFVCYCMRRLIATEKILSFTALLLFAITAADDGVVDTDWTVVSLPRMRSHCSRRECIGLCERPAKLAPKHS
jgi:hypothetical protein